MLARMLAIAGMTLGLVSAASATELASAGAIAVTQVAPYDTPKKARKQGRNMSGLLCPAADWCLLVSDELLGMHRLKVDRSAGRPTVSYDVAVALEPPPPELLASVGVGALEELDLEAVAADGSQAIFIGSHANKRNKGTANPASHLIALVELDALGGSTAVPAKWTSLNGLFQRQGMFPDSLDRALQCRGINIEGATILDGRLLIGLRSPSRDPDGNGAGAYVISTPVAGLPEQDFSDARLHELSLDSPFIGIRAMETVGDTVLLVTGDSGVNDAEQPIAGCPENINREDPSRPFRLRAWKPGADADAQLAPGILAEFPVKQAEDPDSTETSVAKVEGIALAGEDGGAVSLLVVYDGISEVFELDGVELPQ